MRPVSCRTRPGHLAAVLSAAVAAISFAPVARAAVLTWVNSAGGSWSDTANWSPSQVPASSDSTLFNLGAGVPDFAAYPGYTVSLPDGVSNVGLRLRTDKVTLIEPATSTAALSLVYVAAAASERAALAFTDGGTYRANATALAIAGTGTLTLTGGTTYDTGNISAAATGGTGAILVDGAGTKMLSGNELDLSVGPGTSSLDISNGASVYNRSTTFSNGEPDSSSGAAIIGANGGTAHATVSGGGSRLIFGQIYLGTAVRPASTANGALDLRGGGYAYAKTVVVGNGGGTATLALDGPGSTLDVTSELTIGGDAPTFATSHGTGSLSNGATIAAGNATVNVGYSHGVGSLSLAAASSLSASILFVGSYGFATQNSVDVASGSTLTSRIASIGGAYSTPDPSVNYSVGTVTLGSDVPNAPSTWTNSDDMVLYTGSVTLNAGSQLSTKTLDVRDLGTLALHGGTATLSSALRVAGTIAGAGTLHAPTVSVLAGSPRIAPDGTLALDADLSLLLAGSAPTLAFDITSPSTYDRLTSIHTLTFGGTLAVSLASSYAPQLGDAFDLLDFASRAGSSTFSALSLPPLPPGLSWDASSVYTTGTLAISPEPSSLLTACAFALPLLPRRRTKAKIFPLTSTEHIHTLHCPL